MSPESPVLETPSLRLAPVSAADAAWLQEVMRKPQVNASTLVVPTPCPPGFAETWVAEALAKEAAGRARTYCLFEKDGGRPVGSVFLLLNPEHSHAELGYFVDPDSWGKGYGGEAAEALIRFAFQSLGLNRVFAVHFSENVASGRIMQKAGMHHEGCRRGHIRKNGKFVDIEQYGLLKADWERLARGGPR